MSVFIINNEWTDIAGSESAEVVGGKWFECEDDAWLALKIIADSYGADLLPTETSFSLEDHAPNLVYEEYYIYELTRG